MNEARAQPGELCGEPKTLTPASLCFWSTTEQPQLMVSPHVVSPTQHPGPLAVVSGPSVSPGAPASYTLTPLTQLHPQAPGVSPEAEDSAVRRGNGTEKAAGSDPGGPSPGVGDGVFHPEGHSFNLR